MLRKFTNYLRDVRRRRAWKQQNILVAKGSFVHPQTSIGRFTRVNYASHIGQCEIGSFCAIGGRLVVRSSNHIVTHLNMNAYAQKKFMQSSEPVAGFYETLVKIGHGVWIGDSVIILPNVNIGNGAVIGAGSIVTKDIPPFAIAVGNPARVIKYRFTQKVRDKLNDIQWWHWSEEKVKLNKQLFEADLAQLSEEECMAMLGKIRES